MKDFALKICSIKENALPLQRDSFTSALLISDMKTLDAMKTWVILKNVSNIESGD